MLSVLFIFLNCIVHIRAFTITEPDSNGWPRNVGLMTVRWNMSPSDPPSFTMLLRDASKSSVVNPLAIAANVPSASGSYQLDLPTVPVSPTYQILFVDPINLSQVFTTSPIFPISTSPNATASETVTLSTLTTTFTLFPSSSTIPSTASLTTSSMTTATSTTTSTLALTSTTSILGTTGTVTVTVTNPDASFVPINAAAGRSKGVGNWMGLSGVAGVVLFWDGL
ncbi:hypothetical protein RSOLAG22IIIB_07405 [Rhizoctonia solani]|uniref:Yeast cell wall synthesis Kre9/Knh1-like N-terminal domain-containing protein n=1 Tax=Rhizoctonia solani TaxID=456999 RepID=A0A0K6FML4_9AGAM|nr:hypothetical protein RSOLAG22IIIB_07405 [Rhizoctonia solani]